jgi:hypothetical protein
MSNEKRVMPYARLKEQFREFIDSIRYAQKKEIWSYPAATDYRNTWQLADLYQRVAAGDQLGYDVLIECNGKDLKVSYRKRPAMIPWNI